MLADQVEDFIHKINFLLYEFHRFFLYAAGRVVVSLSESFDMNGVSKAELYKTVIVWIGANNKRRKSKLSFSFMNNFCFSVHELTSIPYRERIPRLRLKNSLIVDRSYPASWS